MSEKVEMIKIAKLKPWDRNPRTMDDSELAKLKKSIEQFGFVDPVLIDEHNLIIGGHQRVRAAQSLGWTEVPCLRIPSGWDEHKKAALNLALNKIHGDWDEEKLADILAELGELPDFDMELTGFDSDEMQKLFNDDIEHKNTDELTMQFKIIIDCASEQEQLNILEKLQKEGIQCKPLML